MRAVIDCLVWDTRFASEGLAWQQQERLRRFLRGPGLRTLQAHLQAQMPADGRVTVQATFSEAGTYTLRGLADDGALLGSDDVTVTVIR